MKQKPATYLDRALTICAVHYALVVTQEQYHAELDRLGVEIHLRGPFTATRFDGARTNFYDHSVCQNVSPPVLCVALVGIDKGAAVNHDNISVAALLVHEAVHIWQKHTTMIGSFNDHGDEEEAYGIQTIAQELMLSYREQVYGRVK